MPRGGKRPGAGAPKGNFNAVRSGDYSSRMLMVYLALVKHPDHKSLAWDLYEHGFFPPPSKRFNKDVRGVVDDFWRKWFDRFEGKQSETIRNDQTSPLQPALSASDQPGRTAKHENA